MAEHTLTLTDTELKTLFAILWVVGGNPEKSPRKHADNILEKVMAINLPYDKNSEFFIAPHRTLNFNSESMKLVE